MSKPQTHLNKLIQNILNNISGQVEKYHSKRLLIQNAKGIWADREDIDIPDLQQLRQEWERF